MKKVLIVAKDEIIRTSLKLSFENMKFKTVVADHAGALNMFFTEEPSAVVICDYNEKNKEFKGVETYADIKNSATNEIIFRLGFSKLDHADYLQIPCDLKELNKKLALAMSFQQK